MYDLKCDQVIRNFLRTVDTHADGHVVVEMPRPGESVYWICFKRREMVDLPLIMRDLLPIRFFITHKKTVSYFATRDGLSVYLSTLLLNRKEAIQYFSGELAQVTMRITRPTYFETCIREDTSSRKENWVSVPWLYGRMGRYIEEALEVGNRLACIQESL